MSREDWTRHHIQSVLPGYWCKQKCRWLFKVARTTRITVSWKLGTVEQWNLVRIQMGPLRDGSHVHTNSISRGAHYQKEPVDIRECFPEQDLHEAARPAHCPGWWAATTVIEWMHPGVFIACPLSDEQQRMLSVNSGWCQFTMRAVCIHWQMRVCGQLRSRSCQEPQGEKAFRFLFSAMANIFTGSTTNFTTGKTALQLKR